VIVAASPSQNAWQEGVGLSVADDLPAVDLPPAGGERRAPPGWA
jgi:hypothetical protein